MTHSGPILLMSEGDAETFQSFSGSARAIVTELRSHDREVRCIDVLASAPADLLSKVLTAVPSRTRWAARHHYGPIGRSFRSKRAHRAVVEHPRGAPVLQIGATFDAAPPADTPFFLYCDANAAQGARGGVHSSVTALTRSELAAMIAREKRVYDRAWGIFTISECLRRSFIEDFGISPERVMAVHPGANIRGMPRDAEVASARKSDHPTVLFVGRRFERKGGQTLLDAFKVVRGMVPDAELIIAGTVVGAGGAPGVTVVGHVDPDTAGPGSLNSLYERADIFCMPSHYEPFGIVFVEAMLHGLPCIGTDRWAMPEIIDDGETGWLVPVGDPDVLARVLATALANRPRLREMGLLARQRALARFSWSRAAARMIEFMTIATPPNAGPVRADRAASKAFVAAR